MRALPSLHFFILTLVSPLACAETLEFEGALYHLHRIPRAQQSKLHLRWLDRKEALNQ